MHGYNILVEDYTMSYTAENRIEIKLSFEQMIESFYYTNNFVLTSCQ